MYYGLTNFYQNHRRYVKSRDDNQLLGEFSNTVSSDCSPFDLNNGIPIVPCGAIANSLFNDTLQLFSKSFGPVLVKNTGIAWPSDKDIKFRNPDGNLTHGILTNYIFKEKEFKEIFNSFEELRKTDRLDSKLMGIGYK